MKKVLTERPRRGGIYAYKDFRSRENRGDPDDLPSHQGMRFPYGWDRKTFDDLLGPLKAFLRSCVGRRWDDVWSEISQVVGSGSTVDQHLRSHVMMEVETDTFVVDGHVYALGRYGRGRHAPDGLYVDPVDGVLRWWEPPSRGKYKHKQVDGIWYTWDDDGILHPANRWNSNGRYPIKLLGDERAVRIDGIWYWVIWAVTPPPVDAEYVDAAGQIRTRRVYRPRYDFIRCVEVKEGRYAANKRQMSCRDLRKNGLTNCR
jgi:hypothetical protein